MFGISGGMLRTLEHFVRPRPVTRKYPYEKRVLPERSRGLIALLLEPETSIFKCESCLMCEKACPPRAISISYTFRNSFRRRPLLAPRANYYRIRMVAAAPYGDRRPLSTAVTTIPAEDEAKLDLKKARAVLDREKEGADRMTRVLYGIQQAYGYLPWTAAELDAAVERIAASGLRGRGGAGFALADKLRAVRTNAAGSETYVVANAYDADPDSPLARTLLERSAELVVRGIELAMVITGALHAFLYLHPAATGARSAAESALAGRDDIEIALGPGGFMGGEESALLNVLESKRAMARQRPPYPALQGYRMRPTL